MSFSNDTFKEITGISFIFRKLAPITSYGEEEKKKVRPFKASEEHRLILEFQDLDRVKNFIENNSKAYEDIRFTLMKLRNIRGIIEKLSKYLLEENKKALDVLDEVELFEIKNFSINVCKLNNILCPYDLKLSNVNLSPLKEIVDILNPWKDITESFYISPLYSINLKKILDEMNSLENNLKLCDFSDKDKKEHILEKIKKLKEKQNEEESKVLNDLTIRLSHFCHKLKSNCDFLGRLDFLMAKAELDGVRPLISKEDLVLTKAYNPLFQMELSKRNREYKKETIELMSGTTLITGANMGGKTTTLKTIALNAYLFLCGFYVYAESACVPMLDFIFINFELENQSLEGLSSFAEDVVLVNQAASLSEISRGLILIDEFARGTNPKEGTALVKAVCSYFNDKKSISVITTHFDGVYKYVKRHYEVIGLKNCKNIESCNLEDYMDYGLELVKCYKECPKDAIRICRALNINKEILDNAEKYIEEDSGVE